MSLLLENQKNARCFSRNGIKGFAINGCGSKQRMFKNVKVMNAILRNQTVEVVILKRFDLQSLGIPRSYNFNSEDNEVL